MSALPQAQVGQPVGYPYPQDEDVNRCCRCGRPFFIIITILGVIGGGALIGVGAAQFSDAIKREELVDEYNRAVAGGSLLNEGLTATFQQVYPGAPSFDGSMVVEPVRPIGSSEDVRFEDSRLLSTRVSPWYSTSPLRVTTTGVAGSDVTSVALPFTVTLQAPMFCGPSACDKNCDRNPSCSMSSLNWACRANYGDSATFQGSSCEGTGALCGSCSYTGYLYDICLVVDPTLGRFDASYGSCYYPFTSGSNRYSHHIPPQGTNSSEYLTSISVTIRSNTDAFITMQRLTKGTMDFGRTHSENVKAGIFLCTLGAFMIVAFVGGLCCFWYSEKTETVKARRQRQREMEERNIPIQSATELTPYPPQEERAEAPMGYPPPAQARADSNPNYVRSSGSSDRGDSSNVRVKVV